MQVQGAKGAVVTMPVQMQLVVQLTGGVNAVLLEMNVIWVMLMSAMEEEGEQLMGMVARRSGKVVFWRRPGSWDIIFVKVHHWRSWHKLWMWNGQAL